MPNVVSKVVVTHIVRCLREELAGHGIKHVEVLAPGPQVAELYTVRRDRDTPQMAFSSEALSPPYPVHGAFWIFGHDNFGVAVMMAFNFIKLGRKTLAEHLKENGPLYTLAKDRVIDPVPKVYASPAYRLSGSCTYIGEGWFRTDGEEGPSYRGKGLSRIMMPFGIALAYLTYEPDFVFGLASPKEAEKGVTLRFGLFQSHPAGAVWTCEDGEVHDYLVLTKQKDYSDLFGLLARRYNIVDGFGGDEQADAAVA